MGTIYTRTGDHGETSLGDGSLVPKDHARVEAYGSIDELNAAIGLFLEAFVSSQEVSQADVTTIQEDLFCIGAYLASPGVGVTLPAIPIGRVASFESAIDRMMAVMPPLDGFILPGGSRSAALAHVACTVCRRAERRVVALYRSLEVPDDDSTMALRYLNRLSDYLFCLARYCNSLAGTPDQYWTR
ncbi:MAG: cob(I)yrinic acid a,c-diamide adenosyltransferase [Candidatus Pacebacteria bacterium]|nr:cob(I)yrinic acid a,c-diamide adenosyltransferase [Candidatus Paceibacterota bacterium]